MRKLFITITLLLSATTASAGNDIWQSLFKDKRMEATQGNSSAQYEVGAMYQNGRGVQASRDKAIEWYEKAAAQNNTNAVSRLKLMQANREVQQANLAKSAFLANMSHELRTPLNSVIAMSDILLEKYFGELTPRQEEYVANVRESGDHLLSLINDVLDLSKIEVGRMELQNADFDLTSLIHDLSVMFQFRCQEKQLGWRVEWKVGGEAIVIQAAITSRVLVHGDEGKLRQVLINLLSNALHAVRGRTDAWVEMRLVGIESRVVLTVSDNGPGIPGKDLQRIFDPYFTTRPEGEGTGLGLGIVRRIVAEHAGTVFARNRAQGGASLEVTPPHPKDFAGLP